MTNPDVNPYESPGTVSPVEKASLADRLACPWCGGRTMTFRKLYWVGAWYLLVPYRCDHCGSRMKPAKRGFGRVSSLLMGVAVGILFSLVAVVLLEPSLRASLGGFIDYLVLPSLLAVLSVTLVFDYFIDRHFLYWKLVREGRE